MSSFFLRLAAVLAVAASLFAPGAQAATRTIMVFGDSLSAAYGISPTQGWVTLLGERIAKAGLPWKVVNASVSGETTAGGLRRLAEDLKRHKPDLVLVELGANDALRGQPLSTTRKNLETMIRLSREARAEPVLIGLMIPPNYGIDYAREFSELYSGTARRERVALVPFLLEGLVERRDLFQPDQMHPTAAAQSMILDTVWKVVEPMLKNKPARP
jgi:acyl-CoA thioesterase-1